MCGRFYIEIPKPDLVDILAEVEKNVADKATLMTLKMEGEIFPTNVVPVRTATGFVPMRWGFSLDKRSVINARSETVMEKPLFRTSMLERRCLVMASGYYEWKHEEDGSKTKYQFFDPGGAMLALAGCYHQEKEYPMPSFVILTKAATPELAPFHDRMPVIIAKEHADEWLGIRDADVTALIHGSFVAVGNAVA